MVVHLKARHAQFNMKSDIFGLKIGTFQARSFPRPLVKRNEDAGYEAALERTVLGSIGSRPVPIVLGTL